SLNAGLSYSHAVAEKSVAAVPFFLENLLRAILPAKVESSDAFGRLTASRLRFTPAVVSFNTDLSDQISRSYNYDRILKLDTDTLIKPIESPRQGMQNNVTVGFQPFSGLTTDVSLSSGRDLLDPE